MTRFLATVCVWAGVALAQIQSTWADTERLISSRQVGQIDRVRALLEVGGEMRLVEDAKPVVVKMSVVGNFQYDEKLLEGSSAAPVSRAMRNYRQAEAVIKVEDGGLKPRLRDERSIIAVEVANGEAKTYSPRGALTREELDLLEIPGNSQLIDGLLPDRAVTIGDQWPIAETLLAELTGIDIVNQTDVVAEVKDINSERAQIEFGGLLQGGFGGVSTEIELKGRYKFDKRVRRITWLAMIIKEKRAIGHVSPGLDVVARLQMTVDPGAGDSPLEQISLRDLPSPAPDDVLQLSYISSYGRWKFQHGRGWHVTHEDGNGAALRLLDRGDLIAQCNVSSLSEVAAGSPTPLAEFQNDVEKALGDNFGQFTRASTYTLPDKHAGGEYLIHRLEAIGTVAELPIQWNYFLIQNQAGQRVVLAFTFESELAERMANTDEEIVNSFEFIPVAEGEKGEPTPAHVRVRSVPSAPTPIEKAADAATVRLRLQ